MPTEELEKPQLLQTFPHRIRSSYRQICAEANALKKMNEARFHGAHKKSAMLTSKQQNGASNLVFSQLICTYGRPGCSRSLGFRVEAHYLFSTGGRGRFIMRVRMELEKSKRFETNRSPLSFCARSRWRWCTRPRAVLHSRCIPPCTCARVQARCH